MSAPDVAAYVRGMLHTHPALVADDRDPDSAQAQALADLYARLTPAEQTRVNRVSAALYSGTPDWIPEVCARCSGPVLKPGGILAGDLARTAGEARPNASVLILIEGRRAAVTATWRNGDRSQLELLCSLLEDRPEHAPPE